MRALPPILLLAICITAAMWLLIVGTGWAMAVVYPTGLDPVSGSQTVVAWRPFVEHDPSGSLLCFSTVGASRSLPPFISSQ